MRLTLYEASTRETRPVHNTGNFVLTLCYKCMGSLTSLATEPCNTNNNIRGLFQRITLLKMIV